MLLAGSSAAHGEQRCLGLPRTRLWHRLLFSQWDFEDVMVQWSRPSPAAQPCSVLCPGTFGQPAAPLRHPERSSPGQASSKQQKVFPRGSPGRRDKLWCAITGCCAMLCPEHCLGGAVTASSISFHPCPAAKGWGGPPSLPLLAALPGIKAAEEVQPHSWV